MRLGDFIKQLADMDPSLPITFEDGDWPGRFDSYRGYYDQLALDRGDGPKTVVDVLTDAQKALGKWFHGYKGGDYQMSEDTALWISEYGEASGVALTGLAYEGKGVVIEATDISDYA